jgi:ABC-2 type transport system permease protein
VTWAVKLLRDTWLIFAHEIRLIRRYPGVLLFSLGQPLAYLFFFAPFLRVALRPDGVTSYAAAYRLYIPGLYVAMGLFGGLASGYGLLSALRAGIIDRCRVTPVSRAALLIGRGLLHVVMVITQAAVITVAALPFGLTVRPDGLIFSYFILATMVLFSATISYDIALMLRSEQGLGTAIGTVAQPVSLLAGVLIPLALAPLWIRDVALANPFAWGANGMRALFAGKLTSNVVWESALIMVVLTVAIVAWSTRLVDREA